MNIIRVQLIERAVPKARPDRKPPIHPRNIAENETQLRPCTDASVISAGTVKAVVTRIAMRRRSIKAKACRKTACNIFRWGENSPQSTLECCKEVDQRMKILRCREQSM